MNKLVKTICAVMLMTCLTVAPVCEIQAATQTSAAQTSSAQTPAAQVPAASEVPAEAMHAFAQSVINAVTTPDMTQDQKLKACYEYCLDLMTYQRDNAAPITGGAKQYALEAFYTGRGNCYRYACAFAYLAAELGYETRIIAGQCISSQGGWTPHGWCEIKDAEGQWKIYDLSFGDSNRGKRNFFGITEQEHPRGLRRDEIWSVEW